MYPNPLSYNMERKIAARLLEWKQSHGKTALVVKGPRGVGKTHSVTEFARRNYAHVVHIDFEDEPRLKGIFEGDVAAPALYERLSYDFPDLMKGDCALVLDEVQLCPRAMYSLKPLAMDGRCDVIAIESFPTYADDVLSPMGYTETIVMDTMDFEEFLWAMGLTRSQTDDVHRHVRDRVPFDGYILKRLTDLFRRYIVIGGMPEAVGAYAESRSYRTVSAAQGRAHDMICEDARNHAGRRADRLKIVECLDSVPRQIMGRGVFSYSDILGRRGVGFREYGSALMWLEDARIIDVIHNVEVSMEPLGSRKVRGSFRVYMKDTGLLVHSMGPGIASGIVYGDPFSDSGRILENAVCECLIRKGYEVNFFRRSRKRMADGTVVNGMELDLVVDLNGTLTAIEVGPPDGKRSDPLVVATAEFGICRRMRASDSNIMTDEKGIEHYPLFALAFFEESRAPDICPVDVAGLSEALEGESG